MCKKLSSRECNLCQQVNSTTLKLQVNTYTGPAPSSGGRNLKTVHEPYKISRPAKLTHIGAAFAFLSGGYRLSAVPLYFFYVTPHSIFRQEQEGILSRSVRMPFPCRLQGYGRPSPTEGRTTITGLTSAPRRSPSCRRWRLRERPWAGPCRRSGSRSRRLRDGCG